MLHLLWIIPGFVLSWCGLFAVLARVGGWHALAQHYRTSAVPAGIRFRMQSAQFGWVGYNGCIGVRVAAEGLYLAIWPMFRICHPPLLIPWAELRVLKVRDSWWRRDVTLAVGTPEVARVCLPLRIVDAAGRLQTSAEAGGEELKS